MKSDNSTSIDQMALDQPISDPSEDQLGRDSFADNVTSLILDSPPKVSFRIGIFGEWGEGKTSVLKLVESKLRARDNPCVWLLPWAARDQSGLWRDLIAGIAEELEMDSKAPRRSSASWHWWLRKARGMERRKTAIQKLRAAATLTSAGKLFEAAFGEEADAYLERFALDRWQDLLAKILDVLGEKRLTVFVDDLDRTQPEQVPEILLNLRETLNLPGVFFVIALSPNVVEQGLKHQHPAWGDSAAFLEKIVEWPLHLPRLTEKQQTLFLRRQADLHRGKLDQNALEGVFDVLPRNPRRAKLLLRQLASLKVLMNRFGPEELDRTTFYLCQILRLEFPEESAKLASDEKAVEAIEQSRFSQWSQEDREDKEEERPEMKHAPKDEVRRERFATLTSALGESVNLNLEPSLEEMLILLESPPLLTKKEFHELLERFQSRVKTGSKSVIESWLRKREEGYAERASALFLQAIEHRGNLIHGIVDLQTEKEIKEALPKVEPLTRLLEMLILHCDIVQIARSEGWVALVGHLADCADWMVPEYYLPLRDKEIELLRGASAELPIEIQIEIIDCASSRKIPSESKSTDFFRELEEIFERFRIGVSKSIVDRFREEEGIGSLFGRSSLKRDMLLDPESTFHKEEFRQELFKLGKSAKKNNRVQKNFLDYFSMLADSAVKGDQGSARLLKDLEFSAKVWQSAVAKPLNKRTMGSLRERFGQLSQRFQLSSDKFPKPDWWKRREPEWFGPNESGES